MADTEVVRLARRLARLRAPSTAEREALARLPLSVAEVPAGYHVARQGDRPKHACLVVEGFAAMQKITADGRRQILSFCIPGDVPDLQSFHLGVMDCGLATLTRAVLAFIPHAALRETIHQFPGLGEMLWHLTLVDASIYREWIANIGQREARARVACILCEIMVRMQAAGLADGHRCYFPITQVELADATGISVVHMNRTMQFLRQAGYVSLADDVLTVLDWPRLSALATFDPTYLHLEPAGD